VQKLLDRLFHNRLYVCLFHNPLFSVSRASALCVDLLRNLSLDLLPHIR
jgi:hypothetical protein